MISHNHDHNDHDHAVNIPTNRLEAFSDGVLAIVITITVLELKIPLGNNWHDLKPLIPLAIAYLVSFQAVGTYWNNHHHLLRAASHVSAGMMWANLHLLFWLSLIPFSTGWIGANHGGSWPTALYAAILFMSAIAYSILQATVLFHSDKREGLMAEFNKKPKGFISLFAYALAIAAAFWHPWIADVLIVLVALLWFVPDKRIEMFL